MVTLGNSDVTLFTPRRTPRVSYDPGVSSVTNDGNTVIKGSTASDVVDDTTSVVLEWGSVGFNGNRDDLSGSGSLKSLPVVGRDILVTSVLEDDFVSIVLALAVNTLVIVRFFGLDTLLSNIGESVVHKTSVATVVLSGAVNELLFREREELTVEGLETFKSGNSGESPARSALSLVLNGINTLASVVDGLRVGASGEVDSVLLGGGFTSETEVDSGEFFVGKIGELVDTDSVGSFNGVVGVNNGLVGLEDGESLDVFGTTILLVVFSLESQVLRVERVSGEELFALVAVTVVEGYDSDGSEGCDKGNLCD